MFHRAFRFSLVVLFFFFFFSIFTPSLFVASAVLMSKVARLLISATYVRSHKELQKSSARQEI